MVSNSTMFSLKLLLSLILLVSYGSSLDTPCTEKLLDQTCLFSEECFGANTQCVDGFCACSPGFDIHYLDSEEGAEEDRDEDRPKRAVCKRGGGMLNDECVDAYGCQPPLTCRQGKCDCQGGSWNSRTNKCQISCGRDETLLGHECVVVKRLGDRCGGDGECRSPFSVCGKGGRCECVEGTKKSRSRCVARCPGNQAPLGRICKRGQTNDLDFLAHASSTDSCPTGEQCFTFGRPNVGHCCPLRCPLGDAHPTQTCDAGAEIGGKGSGKSKCRDLTHYCYSVDAPGWKSSLCCPRPCREPNPHYIAGDCFPSAHFGDPCQFSLQCEGGRSMKCRSGRCKCRQGYSEIGGKFPTCVKNCPQGQLDLLGRCSPKVKLDQTCLSSSQCPNYGKCYFGKCDCMCGIQRGGLFGGCFNPGDPLGLGAGIDLADRFFSQTF